MAIEDLVQVDDNAWIDPIDVTAVKHWPAHHDTALRKDIPANTVISHRGGTHTVTYWSFDRVRVALGLADRSQIPGVTP